MYWECFSNISGESVKIVTLIEINSAAHLTHYVASRFQERGGLMMVGPPACLKTAATECLDQFPNARLLSDLTIKGAARMRESLIAEKLVTLAFTDFAKIYQRNASSAANIQGFLSALVAEGFRQLNWEDSDMQCRAARALVIGCMTTSFYQNRFSIWKDEGFARRFLWSHFYLYDPDAIIEAIIQNVRLEFSKNGFSLRVPTSRAGIPYKVEEKEARELTRLLRYQPGKEIGLILLSKILSALKWKHPKEPDKPMAILKDFAESLSKEGAELHLKE